MSEWIEVATDRTGDAGSPGSQYHLTDFSLGQRDNRWRLLVREHWGSNRGYYQENGANETEGRGDSPEEACEAVRKDIFAWCGDSEQTRAEYATALRQLCYAVEDDEEEDDEQCPCCGSKEVEVAEEEDE